MAPFETLETLITVWRQVKRVIAAGFFVAGAYLLWSWYTGEFLGVPPLFMGGILTVIGLVGMISPSNFQVLGGGRNGPD